MDNLAQFVLIAKSILRELRALNQTLATRALGIQPANDAGESVPPHQAAADSGNSPPEQPPIIPNVPPSPPKDNDTDGCKDYTPAWKKIVEIGALLLALGLLIVTIIQTVATRDAVNLTREQVHIGQRAYLYLHNAVLTDSPKAGESLHATLDLTNSGQTPAKDIYYSEIFIVSRGVPQVTAPYTPISPIPAGQKITINTLMLNKLTDSDLKNITDGMPSLSGNVLTIPSVPQLYLRVFVKYKDVFSGDGETEYCGVYFASRESFASCLSVHSIMK